MFSLTSLTTYQSSRRVTQNDNLEYSFLGYCRESRHTRLTEPVSYSDLLYTNYCNMKDSKKTTIILYRLAYTCHQCGVVQLAKLC